MGHCVSEPGTLRAGREPLSTNRASPLRLPLGAERSCFVDTRELSVSTNPAFDTGPAVVFDGASKSLRWSQSVERRAVRQPSHLAVPPRHRVRGASARDMPYPTRWSVLLLLVALPRQRANKWIPIARAGARPSILHHCSSRDRTNRPIGKDGTLFLLNRRWSAPRRTFPSGRSGSGVGLSSRSEENTP